MCDEQTEAENRTYLAQGRLTRRQMGVGAGAVATLYAAGCATSSSSDDAKGSSAGTQTAPHNGGPGDNPAPKAEDSAPTGSDTADNATVDSDDADSDDKNSAMAVNHRIVRIETDAGTAEGFFVAPSAGNHPGVLVWPDVAGLRDAYKKMATRLAQAGYAVLVVNPYYRSSPLPVLSGFDEWRTPEGRAKIGPMRAALTAQAIAQDGAAFVRWLDAQTEVDGDKKIATTGYCMGGPFTFRTAAAAPARVGVIASFHGGGLVTDAEDSPHRLLSQVQAAALICIARNDDERDPDAKTTLNETAVAHGVAAEIEVYPAQHGWCAIDSPVYAEAPAERAWSRMLETFKAHL